MDGIIQLLKVLHTPNLETLAFGLFLGEVPDQLNHQPWADLDRTLAKIPTLQIVDFKINRDTTRKTIVEGMPLSVERDILRF